MTKNELARESDHFPLGAPLGQEAKAGQAVRPFGLRYVTVPQPAAVVQVDFSKISYDPVRQIGVVADDSGRLLPAMKHTSTMTKTSTASHDRASNDSDTDASGR